MRATSPALSALPFLLLCVGPILAQGSGSGWFYQGTAQWANRTGAGADTMSHNGTYVSVVAGGESASSFNNDVWTLVGASREWSNWTLLNRNASWVPRTFHTLTFHAGSVWLMGGYDVNYDFYADVWRSGDGGAEWDMETAPPWQARAGHGTASVNGTLYLMGGYYIDSSFAPQFLKDIWTLNSSGVWAQMLSPPTAGWNERAFFATGVYGGQIYISGGTNYVEVYSDIWVFNSVTQWTQLTPSNGGSVACLLRSKHRMVVTDRMWLVGASHTCWSVDGMSWLLLPPGSVEPAGEVCLREGLVALPHQNSFAVVGGVVDSTFVESWWAFEPCLEACGAHGSCMLSQTANLTASCLCDEGFSGPACTPPAGPSHTFWDNVRVWFNGPAWHVLLVAVSGCVALFVLCPLCLRHWLHKPKRNTELEEVVLGRLSGDWVINPEDLVYNASKPIGAGGFAQVFKGSYNGVPVAVKVIHAFLIKTDDKKLLYMQRFADEAEMMSRLHHPNLQCLLGIALRPQFCLVTEYAPYGSLSDVLSSLPEWTATTAASPKSSFRSSSTKVLYQIACGAMCLHSRSITHRDLNTNNVLVYCLEYERLNVRVSDFGLSRELEAGVAATMTGFVGSPAYIAPEVLGETAKYDEKADVYSYGVLVWSVSQYLFLSLQRDRQLSYDEHKFLMRPYGDWAPLQVMRQVVEGARPKPPPAVFPKAHILYRLMSRCWDADPAMRPTFEQICAELDRHVSEEEEGVASPTPMCDPQAAFSPIPLGESRVVVECEGDGQGERQALLPPQDWVSGPRGPPPPTHRLAVN